MARLISTTISGFGRYIEPVTVTLERRGLVYVEGINRDNPDAFNNNGSGKSMLFEAALAWNPYEKLIRCGNDRITDADVCFEGHTASVQNVIETVDGHFLLHRRREPGGRPYFVVSSSQNGEWVPLRGQDDGIAVRLLGYDYLTLKSALFLHGENMGASSYSTEMKIIEAILRFDDYTKAAKIASTKATNEQRAVDGLISELDRISQQVETTRGTIAELESLDESAREQELQAAITDAETTIAFRAVRTQARDRANDEMQSAHLDVLKLDAAIAETGNHIAAARRFEGRTTCPTCGGPVESSPDAIAVLIVKQNELMDEHKKAVEEHARRRTLWYQADATLKAVDTADNVKTQSQRELVALRDRAAKTGTMLDQQRQRLITTESRAAELTEQIAAARRRLGPITRFVRERVFEELKASDFSKAMPVLDQAAHSYSQMLTDGVVRVTFDSVRASRSEPFIHVSGETGPTYALMSSGEKRRADIIITLARRALARSRMRELPNVSVWDEVFDPLDENGVRRIAHVLREDLDEIESVFVVTHNPHLRALFPSAKTLVVERRGGQSRVIEGANG